MPKAYSLDLRQRVVAAYDDGKLGVSELATRFRVKRGWIYSLLQLRRETGALAPRRSKRGPQPKLATHHQRLQELIQRQPDATLAELRDQLPVQVSVSTIWLTLRELKLTFKKNSARRRTTTT